MAKHAGAARGQRDRVPASSTQKCRLRRKINLSAVFAGQDVGVREVAEHVWLISFMHYDLGFFDHQCDRVELLANWQPPAYS